MSLRDKARGQICVRCYRDTETVVLCHYTGARRLAYGGGFGIKVKDLVGAHLCAACHRTMDTLSRNKSMKWEHSEEFLHLCMLTILRLAEQGDLKW
jgi:hypothetical protein